MEILRPGAMLLYLAYFCLCHIWYSLSIFAADVGSQVTGTNSTHGLLTSRKQLWIHTQSSNVMTRWWPAGGARCLLPTCPCPSLGWTKLVISGTPNLSMGPPNPIGFKQHCLWSSQGPVACQSVTIIFKWFAHMAEEKPEFSLVIFSCTFLSFSLLDFKYLSLCLFCRLSPAL